MATAQELNDKIAELAAAVDAEQAQIQAALDALNATKAALEAEIVTLKEQLAAGATPEQIQASIDSLNVVVEDIKSTIADITPPPTA